MSYTTMENEIVIIYCPDCRGKFEMDKSDIIEEEICECPLCGAEMEILSENPIRLKLYSEEDDF